jgi:hypothetical protein
MKFLPGMSLSCVKKWPLVLAIFVLGVFSVNSVAQAASLQYLALFGEQYSTNSSGIAPNTDYCTANCGYLAEDGYSNESRIDGVQAIADVQAATGLAAEWSPAYLSGWHPWGFECLSPEFPAPASGNTCTDSWLNYQSDNRSVQQPDGLYKSVRYRVRFTVPTFPAGSDGGAQQAAMLVKIKADNWAKVWINGVAVPGIIWAASTVNGSAEFASSVSPGVNTIELVVGDGGGLAGFTYLVELAMLADAPLGVVPPAGSCVVETVGFTECSAACGGGTQTEILSVLTPASNGGAACREPVAQACNTQTCPTGLNIPAGGSNGTIYTDAQVTIPVGQELSVTATGNWNIGGPYASDANGATHYSTETCALSPLNPMGALIGSLDGGLTWFLVGAGPTTVVGPGQLLLTANDCAGPNGVYFTDNTGSLVADFSPLSPSPLHPIDCVVATTGFDACTASCGGGTQNEIISIITQAANGGAACREPVAQACNTQACPVDCVLSDFGSFGACSATACGTTGTQTQTRNVLIDAANGGAACAELTNTQACAAAPCPVCVKPTRIPYPTNSCSTLVRPVNSCEGMPGKSLADKKAKEACKNKFEAAKDLFATAKDKCESAYEKAKEAVKRQNHEAKKAYKKCKHGLDHHENGDDDDDHDDD